MDSPISRAEHDEFVRRMEGEHARQNERISTLERVIDQIQQLLVSVERLTLSIDAMQKEVKTQGTRLSKMESRDGEMWRKLVGYVLTAVIGIVIGFIFRQIGVG